MTIWQDLVGTVGSFFKLGISGVRLKNSSGNLLIRDTGDSADAEVTASKVNISGETIVLNSDATEASSDWKLTLQRNASATESLTLVAPPAKGTDGYVLRQKPGTSSGVLELELAAAGTTDSCLKLDTTTLAFGDSSPVTMFTLPANAVVDFVEVEVNTAFNGTAPTVSIGVSGTTSKFAASSNFDLKTSGRYRCHPQVVAEGSTQALIATYAADSSSAGAALIRVAYSTPS